MFAIQWLDFVQHTSRQTCHPAPALVSCLAMAEQDGMDDELRQALALSMQEVRSHACQR